MSGIAALIADDIIERRPFRALDDPKAGIEAGYAVQFEAAPLIAAARGGIGGRKIGWSTPEQMQKMGLSAPIAASVFADDILRGDATLKLADYTSFVMEPEICAVLAVDLAPRAGGWTRDSAAEAVARLHVAFEFLDRRGGGGGATHPASVIANGIFNAGLCYDGENGVRPADLDPAALTTVVEQDGEPILNAKDAAPQHPLDAVAFLANHFNAHGVTPKAGEILLCGSHMAPLPVERRCRFTMWIAGIGEVSFKLV